MGCENSKTVRVQPVGPSSVSRDNTQVVEGKEGVTQTPGGKPRRGASLRSGAGLGAEEFDLDEQGNKVKRRKPASSSSSSRPRRPRSANTKDLMGSCHSLEDARSMDSDRGFSATSKQSADSGLGEDYSHVITEYSEEDKIREVEKAFKPRDDLELAVTGTPVGTKNSAKDRARMEEAQVMQSLREEGLISKPKMQAAGGMCFEIVDRAAADTEGAPRPPPRLEKLALERNRKKKRAVTEEEIRDKLERAERRRKKKEQERLEKLREMERVDALAALENFAQYQKSKEETLAQRMDQAQDNKERKQRELKEKQERRRRHAEEVRKRKALARENGTAENDENLDEMTSKPDDTPRKSPLMVAESS